MNLQQLKLITTTGESATVEFKKTTTQLRSAYETLCGFLNTKGGIVLIGVNDKGELVGQDITDNTRQEIAKETHRLEPTAPIETDYIPVRENKFVIVLKVNAGQHIPYTYDGRAFQRDESTTHRMSQHRYEQLLIERGQLNHAWEDGIATGYTLNSLDHEEIYKTVADGIREGRIPASAQREDVTAILERLNLMTEGQLKRAAVVLYAKQEALKFPQCMIKMARFKGLNKLGEFIDNQQIYGNAFRILSEADAFLRRHLPIASFFKSDQFKRIDKPALPVMAVREALINTLCHRDYADLSTDIALAVFDDRLELWNSGSLLKKLTVEDLKRTHKSVLRNKWIANAFYVRGLIEKWGMGTNKMVELCRQDGIPEPIFQEEFGGLDVTFKFKEPIGFQQEVKPVELISRQREILKLLEEVSLNSAQIADRLQDSPSVRTVQRDLLKLEKEGIVKRDGKAQTMVWVLVNK